MNQGPGSKSEQGFRIPFRSLNQETGKTSEPGPRVGGAGREPGTDLNQEIRPNPGTGRPGFQVTRLAIYCPVKMFSGCRYSCTTRLLARVTRIFPTEPNR